MLAKYIFLILLMGIELHATPFDTVPAISWFTVPAISVDEDQESKEYLLIITDTIIKSRGAQWHTIAVNGQRPPRIIMISVNDPATLRIRNRTKDDIYIKLPGKLVAQKARTIRQTIQKDAELNLRITTKNAGIYSYQIYHLDQVDNGALGSLAIQ